MVGLKQVQIWAGVIGSRGDARTSRAALYLVMESLNSARALGKSAKALRSLLVGDMKMYENANASLNKTVLVKTEILMV